MSNDDKHSDHDLKAYLDGRDGVSAAYRKSAHEEPPAKLDESILNAARQQVQSSVRTSYARRPYALAASVMVAVAGLSLYLGTRDQLDGPAESPAPRAGDVIEIQRLERAGFANRQLAPAAPAVGAADAPAPQVASNRPTSTDALARGVEAPAIVIDGPLLESIEADAAAAQQEQQRDIASAELEEVQVTGSRIARPDAGDMSYREARDTWLEKIRSMAGDLEARTRLATARGSASALEAQLEEEIGLFREAYPDTDIEAELEN